MSELGRRIPLLGLDQARQLVSGAEQPAALATWDADNTLGKGFPPLKTFLMILKGQMNHQTIREIIQKGPTVERAEKLRYPSQRTIKSHEKRELRHDAVASAIALKYLANKYGINLLSLILSGRGTGLEEQTQNQFTTSGMDFAGMCLNPDRAPHAWKGAVTREVTKHVQTIHIDDDLAAGMAAILSGAAMVFVRNNSLYHPAILARSNFRKPPNLIFVGSEEEIPTRVETAFKKKSIGY